MRTDRLQLTLLLDRQQLRQPLPPDVRRKGIEIIARMLLQVLRKEARLPDGGAESQARVQINFMFPQKK